MKKLFLLILIIILVSCKAFDNNQTPKIINTSIINGVEIKKLDSFAKSVVGVYDIKLNTICTGTLIDSNIVLTAAHCIPTHIWDLKIIFSTNVDSILNAKDPNIQLKYMKTAIDAKVGPTWDPKNETVQFDTGDIALIKFQGLAPSEYRAASFLKNGDDLKIGSIVTIAGFGVNYVDMEEINPKKYRNLENDLDLGDVICSGKNRGNYGTCYKITKTGDGLLRSASAPISFIHETEVRLNEKKAGTCNGDSGGPAFLFKDGDFYLFGVTSRGGEFCNEVGVYTNALIYKSWIEATSKILK
jgi:secreted trypsin-like serine protease